MRRIHTVISFLLALLGTAAWGFLALGAGLGLAGVPFPLPAGVWLGLSAGLPALLGLGWLYFPPARPLPPDQLLEAPPASQPDPATVG